MSYDTYITGGGNPGYDEFDPRDAPEPENCFAPQGAVTGGEEESMLERERRTR